MPIYGRYFTNAQVMNGHLAVCEITRQGFGLEAVFSIMKTCDLELPMYHCVTWFRDAAAAATRVYSVGWNRILGIRLSS